MDRNQSNKRNEFVPLAKLKSYRLRNYNFLLVLLLVAIGAFGVAVIGSANAGDGMRSAMMKQMLGMVLGIAGMLVISLIDYGWLLKGYWLIYLADLAILAAVLKFGKTSHGATRWIQITEGITIQPSEFSKVMLILFFSKFLSAHKEKLSKWWFVFVTAILAGIPLLLIEKEPDLSTTILTALVIISVIFAAGLSYKKIGAMLLVCIPVVIAAFVYIQQPEQKLLDTYQLERILAFVYPEEYDAERYQQDNSVLAIGSGQLYGKGLFNDRTDSMKNANYLSREAVNDFIFAVVGEELGFVGGCVLLGLMFLIAVECLITAAHAPDLTGQLICTGMAMMLCFQTFINVGVATELLPNTGIPLPFISSGLSSLVSVYCGMGFVLNVGLQRVKRL